MTEPAHAPTEGPNASARCHFRLLGESDADLLLALDADPLVMKYINGGKAANRQDIERIALPRLSAYRNPAQGWGLWGVFLNRDDTFIGWILVRPMHFFSARPDWQTLELGWRFLQSTWGQGYATEAARQIMDWQHTRGNQRFCAIALPDNQGSIAVMKKLGMTFQARKLHRDPLFEETVDYYAITLPD